MKALIVEDDITSRLFLQGLIKGYGHADVAVNGKEAIQAVEMALEGDEPYDLILLDIMMPEMDGQSALKEIRAIEQKRGLGSSQRAKIVMTTSLKDLKDVSSAYKNLCDSYLVKPIDREKLAEVLGALNLIE